MDLPKIFKFLEIYTQQDKNINRANFISRSKQIFAEELEEIKYDIDDFTDCLDSEMQRISDEIDRTLDEEQIKELEAEQYNLELDYKSDVENRISDGISEILTKIIDLTEEMTFKKINLLAKDKLSKAIEIDLEKYL